MTASAVMLGSTSPLSHARNGRSSVSSFRTFSTRRSAPKRDGLFAHLHHQLRTGERFGKAREVLDVRREHELAAGLIGGRGRLALDDDRVQLGAGAVDGGSEPGRTRADDKYSSVLGHYFLSLSGRRFRQIIIPASSESTPTTT